MIARLMLPYLAFAGPVTVLMALLNAQGRFALTAFSPLLFNMRADRRGIGGCCCAAAGAADVGRAVVLPATVGVAGARCS